ncbi:hypothetical protein HK104_006232, partial [Borealophlyctis nickersoniae]
MDLLKRYPYLGQPFSEVEGFIEHADPFCDGLFTKKAAWALGLEDTTSPLILRILKPENDFYHKLRNDTLFNLLRDYNLRYPFAAQHYVKDFITDQMIASSVPYAQRLLFARLSLCYHPCRDTDRKNNAIQKHRKQVMGRMEREQSTTFVFKIDDFNWLHVRGLPASSNSSKFSQSRVAAHLACKAHPTIPRLPLNILPANLPSVLLELLPRALEKALNQEGWYREVRGGKGWMEHDRVKKLYAYHNDMSTQAGSLKDFRLLDSIDATSFMKNGPLFRDLLVPLLEMAKPYVKVNTLPLVGDFWVWCYAFKHFWNTKATPELSNQRQNVLVWPDSHVGLNLQQAVLNLAYDIIMPIWLCGFKDAKFNLVKVRPIRRIAILSYVNLAWLSVRDEIRPHFAGSHNIITQTLLWLFEEAIPLALDVPTLLSTGDLCVIRKTLGRVLPMFQRLGKPNYVIVTTYALAMIEFFDDSPVHVQSIFKDLIRQLSSEDLEVFHSIVRASTRFCDSHDQQSRRALFISALVNDDDTQKAIKEIMGPKRSKFGKDYSWTYTTKTCRDGSISFEHESAIRETAKGVQTLFLWHSFDGESFKRKMSTGYLLRYPEDVIPRDSKLRFVLDERILPLTLRRNHIIKLSVNIDISPFQPFPTPQIPSRKRRPKPTPKAGAAADENLNNRKRKSKTNDGSSSSKRKRPALSDNTLS